MANRDIIFGIRITGDSSSAVSEAKKVDKAFDDVSGGLKVVEAAARSTESALGSAMKQATPQPMNEMAAAAHGAADALNRSGEAGHNASKPLNQLGMTAGQTAQAMRQLPMQFTDIFTSLAAGQPPMMVMLQQGGQLKDTFGGIAPAAKAMGGYIAGLVTPLTSAAAAAAALAVAYYQGSEESSRFSTSLIMTGNAVGLTVDKLTSMSAAMGAAAKVTQSFAADALAQVVETGRIAAESVGMVATAAVRMEHATGQSVGETIKQFVELGKEPVKASEKLNEAANYLTADLYKQIKALEDQGKSTEAAALAQKAWADALNDRTAQVTANLGYIETAWHGVIDAAKAGWDAILGVGRAQSKSERIAELEQKAAPGRGIFAGLSGDEKEELTRLKAVVAEEEKTAKAAADRAASSSATITWLKEGEKYLSKAEQRERAIAKARQDGLAAGVAETEIEKRIAAIRDKYKDAKAPKPPAMTPGERLIEDWVKRIQVLQAETGVTQELTETHKAGIKVLTDYANGKLKLTAAEKARLPALVQQALLLDDANEAEKRARAEAAAMAKVQEELIAGERKNTDALLAKVEAAQFEAETYGMSEAAVYRVLSARTQDRIEMLSFGDANDALIAELKAQAQAYLDLADAAGAKASREAAKKAADESKASAQKFADDIERALTDSLMRGFESGKGFGRSFVDSIKNTLKATVLKASVQLVMSPVTGAIQSAYGLGSAGGSVSGMGNLLSTGNMLAGVGNLSTYTGAAGYLQLGSMASSFSTGLTAAAGGADLAAAVAAYEAAGMGATASAISAGASAAGALGGAAATVGSAISALSAAAPYLAVGLLAAQQLGVFSGPTYHHGGAYQADTAGGSTRLTNSSPGLAGFDLGWGAYNSDRSAAFDDAMKTMSFGIATQIADSIKKYGGDPASLKVSARFASDNSDYSVGALRITDAADKTLFDLDKHYSAQAEKGMQEFTADATRALVGALKATKLDAAFAAVFANVDPLTSSIEALNAALTQAAAIQQQTESIRAAIDTNFLAPTEQLDKAFAKIGQTVPATASGYEDLVRAQDLTTAAGRDMAAALLSAYPLWGQVQDAATQAAQATAQAAQAAADATAQAAQAAADAAAQAAAAVASQRSDLEKQLLELQGNTAELRRRELLGIDASNQALQLQIWALQDSADAAKAAAQAEHDHTSALQASKDAADAAVKGAEDSLRAAYQQESAALKQTVDKFAGFATSLKKIRDGLITSSSSPLSGSARAAEMERQWQSVSARARLGDVSAIESMQGMYSDYLATAKDSAVSAEDYYRKFAAVSAVLQDTESLSTRQADVAQQQLDTLTDQVGALITLNDSVLSVRDAITALADAKSAAAAVGGGAMLDAIKAGNITSPLNENGSRTGIGDSGYQILDNGGSATLYFPGGGTHSVTGANAKQMLIDTYGLKAGGLNGTLIRTRAVGGYTPPGLTLVGEYGPEVVNFAQPSMIYTAAQSKALMSGGDGLVVEVQALRTELTAQRAALEAIARHAYNTYFTLDRVTSGGNSMRTTEVAA